MIPIGARLAEMARIRLRYDEARRHVQTIQQVMKIFFRIISPFLLKFFTYPIMKKLDA